MSRHLVFAGNPGTGKTTVARLYGRLLDRARHAQPRPSRRGRPRHLVGEYVGHTGSEDPGGFERASAACSSSTRRTRSTPDGTGNNDFGQEAIATLVKLMEDHREEVVVIVAGYPTEMRHFIDANPGLASRFTRTLTFDD